MFTRIVTCTSVTAEHVSTGFNANASQIGTSLLGVPAFSMVCRMWLQGAKVLFEEAREVACLQKTELYQQ